jgi:hypothetical protein
MKENSNLFSSAKQNRSNILAATETLPETTLKQVFHQFLIDQFPVTVRQ